MLVCVAAFRSGKNSDSVSILQQIKKLNTSKVEEVLYSNLESLQGILRNHAQIPRTLKVHLVELFMNMVRICSRVSTSINLFGTIDGPKI